MKKLTAILSLLALLVLASPQHADAAATVMCAPNPIDSIQPRQIVVPTTGAQYLLNGQGCAVVQQADVIGLQQTGFTAGPPFGPNIIKTTGVQTGTTSVQVGTLPAGAYIQHIIVQNLTANAITGGLTFGSSSGGADVVSALACAANCLVYPADAVLLKRIFSTTAPQPIYATAATAWNNANVTVTIVYGYF